MKASQLREMTTEELSQKHRQLKEELFNIRFQSTLQDTKNNMRVSSVKRDIARVLTIISQRSDGIRGRK